MAELLPLPQRPSTLPWEAFIEDSAGWRADAQLARDLEAILSDTTDDPRLP